MGGKGKIPSERIAKERLSGDLCGRLEPQKCKGNCAELGQSVLGRAALEQSLGVGEGKAASRMEAEKVRQIDVCQAQDVL